MVITSSGTPLPPTAPIPIIEFRPRWRDTIMSFHIREYRWYATGLFLSNVGGWLSRLATDWFVLITTHDPALVGLVIAIQLLPPTIVGAWGGVVSDRFTPKTAVYLCQAGFAMLSALLGFLIIFGITDMFWVFVISILIGLVSCVDGPSRAVLTVQVVGIMTLPNAISLNALVPQLGGIVGASLAALTINLIGTGWSLIVSAVWVVFGGICVLLISSTKLRSRPPLQSGGGHVRAALRYIAHKYTICISLFLVGVLAAAGIQPSILNVWLAENRFGLGATGYSQFAIVGLVGGLIGGIMSTRPRRISIFDNALMLGISGLIWILCGFSPWLLPVMFGLLVVGAMRMLFLVGNDTASQLSTNDGIRGRVVALYLMVVNGGQVVGSIVIGWLIHAIGGEFTFLTTGLMCAIAGAIVCGFLLRRSKRAGHEVIHSLT